MKGLLWIIFLCSCASRYSNEENPPKLTSIHLVDRDGLTEAISNPDRLKNFEQVDFSAHQSYQKVLRIFSRDEMGNIQAYITTYHPNGQIKQYLEVVNNRAYGAYREWFANGNLKVDSFIIEGAADISLAAEKSWLFDGVSTAYNECGVKIAEIPYCRGSLDGCAIYFHSNGTIWKQIPYSQNVISGEIKIYLENGDLLQTNSFEKGVKNGPSYRYWPTSELAAEEYYIQGRLQKAIYTSIKGENIASIENGEGFRALFGKSTVSELHEYHRGLPEGEVKVFDTQGRVIKIYHVKSGQKHGEEIYYYFNLFGKENEPKLSLPWYQGKIQGITKTWYDNGVLESKREMSENTRNGVATAWYRDGQLMMIEEYDQGKLIKGDYYRKGNRNPISSVVNGSGVVTFFDPEGNYLKKTTFLHGKPDE